MNQHNHLDKLILGFGAVFALLIMFSAGAELGEKDTDWFRVAIGITTALFWVGIIAVTVWGRFRTLKDRIAAAERETEMVQRRNDAAKMEARKAAEVEVPEHGFPAELRQFLEETVMPDLKEAAVHKARHDLVRELIDKNGGFPLTEENIPTVEAKFHEITDGYTRIRLEDEGKSLDIQFSEKPFDDADHVPGRSDAHEAARKRGDEARAKDAPKKLSASQQRRINASKGHGPITDAELREKRNEERRAKRAAKKAAATTTTTTTQPGQTSLV